MAVLEPWQPINPDPTVSLKSGQTYKGFRIHHEYPPIPIRQFDWIAVDDNQDGLMVANGKTVQECCADVDRYLEEQDG